MPSNSLKGSGSPDEPAVQKSERLNIREELSETWGQSFLFMSEPDYDAAIIGVMERAGGTPVIAYDTQKILDILEREMSMEEAQEFFEYNILGAYMGDKTPIYITQNY